MKEDVSPTLMESMEKIVLLGFCKITQRLVGIRLKSTDEIVLVEEPVYSGIIKLSGFLEGQMLFVIPKKMAEQIVFQMNHKRELPESEWEGYFKEYLNIVAGCMISQIGNFFGKRVRFSIPMVKQEVSKEMMENQFQCRSRHVFFHELGRVDFILDYNETALDETGT